MGVFDYSSTAGSNLLVGGVSVAEGMARASINNAIRAQMADFANFLKDIGGATLTTNSSNDYSLTLNSAPAAYADNMFFAATINAANTGAARLNVNSLGFLNIKKMVGGTATALASGDLPTNHIAFFERSSANTAFILLNPYTNAYVVGGTDVPVTDGGTGVSTLTGIVKGNGTSPFSAAVQGTDYYAPSGTDVAIADGGTGQSTATTAFQALSPLTTRGDLIRGGATGPQRVALGTTEQVLKSDGTDALWGAVNVGSSSAVTGTLPIGNGGTGLTSGTSGGVPYYSASNALTSSGALTASRLVLGGGAGAAPTVAASLGTTTTLLHGNAAGAPTFGAVDLAADVSGNLGVSHLGSGTSAGATTFWRGDGAWVAAVQGPGSATDNAIVRFDATTGALIQTSGITIDDNNLITHSTTNSGTAAIFTSTDAGAGNGPSISLRRDSASPAVSDVLGQINFQGRDSGNNITNYAQLIPAIADPTDGSEDSSLTVNVLTAGVATSGLIVGGAGITTPAITLGSVSVGAAARPLTTQTATYTATLSDQIILMDTTVTFMTLNLPAAATASGKSYTVVNKTGAHALTFDPNSSEQINNASTYVTGPSGGSHVITNIVCDGTAWYAW